MNVNVNEFLFYALNVDLNEFNYQVNFPNTENITLLLLNGKYDDFYDVIRPVVFAQIVLDSYSTIMSIFFIIISYHMGHSIYSIPNLRLFTAVLTFTINLYIYCNIFTLLETAKSTLNFGLYSSNWTVMDLKFKKTILLAMNFNSAHTRLMKVSPNNIVNLEMFGGIMKMSFSILSVLLNISSEKISMA